MITDNEEIDMMGIRVIGRDAYRYSEASAFPSLFSVHYVVERMIVCSLSSSPLHITDYHFYG